ncbi:hypothetical protein ACFLRB_04850 [Acidobacteriota bacterium]
MGKSGGVNVRVRGLEHITDLEPELFAYIKKHIPRIKTKSATLVQSLIESGSITQGEITEVLFRFYKSRYPSLSDDAIMDALMKGVQ